MIQLSTMRVNTVILLVIANVLIATAFSKNFAETNTPSTAQADQLSEDNWNDDQWASEPSASPWLFSGFAEIGFGEFLQSNVVSSSHALNEISARLSVDYSHNIFELSVSGDARYDDILAKPLWQTRELHLAFSPLDSLDIKLGRQVLTWGTGDYLFINDLFAKDWQSFFAGRDDEYLKAPSDSARLTWYIKGFALDLAWTPEFRSDYYITGERFSFFSPQLQRNIAPAENFNVSTTSDEQWSIRVSRNQAGVEYALYGYQGYWMTPVGAKYQQNQQLTAYFPKLNVWGASARMSLGTGLFNIEYGAYISPEDRRGDHPLIANSQERLLLGYENELVKNLTASVQYYIEKTKDYQQFILSSPIPSQAVDKYRQLLTLRLTYITMQQKLQYSLFSFYSPSDKDGYIKAKLSYRYSDELHYSLGTNLFVGKNDYSFFGQHQDNSNIWLRAKYNF